jgi:hypothetical protein
MLISQLILKVIYLDHFHIQTHTAWNIFPFWVSIILLQLPSEHINNMNDKGGIIFSLSSVLEYVCLYQFNLQGHLK